MIFMVECGPLDMCWTTLLLRLLNKRLLHWQQKMQFPTAIAVTVLNCQVHLIRNLFKIAAIEGKLQTTLNCKRKIVGHCIKLAGPILSLRPFCLGEISLAIKRTGSP